jgi:hypothetical protein
MYRAPTAEPTAYPRTLASAPPVGRGKKAPLQKQASLKPAPTRQHTLKSVLPQPSMHVLARLNLCELAAQTEVWLLKPVLPDITLALPTAGWDNYTRFKSKNVADTDPWT